MPALRVPGGVFLFLPGRGGALSKHPRKGVTQINYGLTDSSKYTDLDELRHLVDREDGDGLQSHIQETFSLAEAARALNVSMGGRVVGKLAICVSCNDSQTSVAQSPSAHAQHGKEYESATVRTGDLVFVQPPLSSQSPFDAAILETGMATIQWMQAHRLNRKGSLMNATATHVAMAWRSSNNSLYYVQALPSVGVVVTSELDFAHELPPGTILYRARVAAGNTPAPFSSLADAAAAVAVSLKGREYAADFEPPSSGRFYCSSLIEYAFRTAANISANATDAGVFLNRPFTLIFKPLQFWKAYYRKLGRTLPLHQTGSNPTLLLHSPAVELVAL